MKKLYAVIGDPIAHSMSPLMHNDLFQYYNLDAHYQPLFVKKENLKEAIVGLKAIGVSGFNVTIPHKTEIIPFLDEVDPLAEQIGAVNTVVNQNGRFVGFNTDGLGFIAGLTSLVPEIQAQNVLLIGAGGAARAIFYTLAKNGIQTLDICNRTVQKATELILDCPYKLNSNALSIKDAENQLQQYDIIIQTTNIGMSPFLEQIPISLERLRSGSIVSDIIYNPLETQLLKAAKEKDAVIQNGIDMFVNQGAIAFQYWTGIMPDVKRMKQNVLDQLGGKVC
ncbi:shikimate dehydrogenase [Pseudoneobacillus rhizosphaerae]|uniref:Shikimate dehydrogenase (NADP(+)) n=1 Tax=Pseudoneobacillus rhizosphaerae TaxID=2880968 RepID=A0A9C7LB27_9BACI|nr:shikimate dehydrogenase [Pseudoneobacillus rhizosphaerae]CAG9608085.1 Shikimate dehydrogenase (NADP(+)) [Pseudoneobacillus rhizosphaerae]